ncbi:MAG: UPF0179 family protein [Methanoregulaceae archaeon]|nr:UPF0179 family protein [Methanoregulaceae archaeon]
MAEAKTKITLIGTELAKQGLEFIYEGALAECSRCTLKKACNNLKNGKKYRVVEVRPTQHPCQVHRNGTYVVEVIEAPISALVNTEMAIKNTKIQYEFSCSRSECSNFPLCHPDGIIDREKYVVTNVVGGVADPCERGRKLQLVDLMPT